MFIEIEDSHIDNFKHKKVILFGAGSCGLHAIEEFEKRNIQIIAFCDNDKNLTGKKFEGYSIIHPEQLYQYRDTNVIITSTFADEIIKQLKSMDIPNIYTAKVGVLKKTISKDEFRNIFLSKEQANRFIYEGLLGNRPFFVGRLGSVELECIVHYLYLLDRKSTPLGKEKYPPNVRNMMRVNAGFFPPKNELLDRFSETYLIDMKGMDLIWSMWLSKYEDWIYHDFYKERYIAKYEETYLPLPYEIPWTEALEGKKVLVIHPFEQSIKENNEIKDKFYRSKILMPQFDLLTLKAVQSIAETPVNYKDWFCALEDMKQKIDHIDFDIALIGAGAYGLSLAAYIKRIGKKAIHVGGALQLYFGIKGKAWNNLNIYNEYWTSPKDTERPKNYRQVESGRYW